MARVVGYGMLFVVAVMVLLTGMRITSFMALADVGLQRTGAVHEIMMLALCGIVIPLGISALLLKKS